MSEGNVTTGEKDLLSVADVAGYLGVGQVTVYRWCREGRLPCLKVGKSWRVRRNALEAFLRRSERPATLAGQLRSFLNVPDNVVTIAQNKELLHRLDAAFFQVAEAQGGLMVKFHGAEMVSEDDLREDLERHGFEATRLEREGRFRFSPDRGPLNGRADALQEILEGEAESGRTIWVAFNWSEELELEDALRQQEALTEFVNTWQLVVKTAVLEEAAQDWPLTMQRRAQTLHSGTIWISEEGLVMSRAMALPQGT